MVVVRRRGRGIDGTIVGETHHSSKLTDHDVDLIIKLKDAGLKNTDIAKKFEVSESTIRQIYSGEIRSNRAIEYTDIQRKPNIKFGKIMQIIRRLDWLRYAFNNLSTINETKKALVIDKKTGDTYLIIAVEQDDQGNVLDRLRKAGL